MNLTLLALLGIGIMVLLLFLGMNIGISMILVGIAGTAIAIYLIAQLFEALKSTFAIFNAEVRADVKANWPA